MDSIFEIRFAQKVSPIVWFGIIIAFSAMVSEQAFAQTPNQCQAKFERGRTLDNRLNRKSDAWLRNQEAFFDRWKKAVLDTRRLVDGDESPRAFDTVRGHMQALIEMLDALEAEAGEVGDAVEQVSDLLSDLEIDCGIPPSIEDWFEKKTEIIEQFQEQVPKSLNSFRESKTQFESYLAEPSKLLRRIDLLKEALDRAVAESSS